MELAQGDYIGIINSDDVYKKNAFDIIQKYIKLNPDVDFIFGSVNIGEFYMVIGQKN